MRVISGIARGRKLKKVPGDSTRPIMDRVKENLFNIVGEFVWDSRWLDLFAGTGQVGIEALSRGATEVVFVDSVRAAAKTIQANLAHTGLTNRALVVQTDAFRYLDSHAFEPFDLIYVAPPQYKNIWVDVMRVLDERPFAYLKPDGLIVVQIDPKEYIPLELTNLILDDKRKYGNTLLCFYEPVETE
ncbi:MAG: 16S rRNA (guanine(966)-N(2))-methyltransferase RsmD [Anaerolineales bacterium]|nr:16S rRNA (guanine(966)-N(2))-methyltransferase RsmD [Anaerolineales bacterium]